MIRKLILGFCFLLAMFPASAFSLEGLSVESPREQVVVFIDGKQVCRPTYSCFIANLHGGSYRVPPVVETALKERTYCLMSVFIVRVGR